MQSCRRKESHASAEKPQGKKGTSCAGMQGSASIVGSVHSGVEASQGGRVSEERIPSPQHSEQDVMFSDERESKEVKLRIGMAIELPLVWKDTVFELESLISDDRKSKGLCAQSF